MRVYEPDPKDHVISDVLKDLYLLRQAVDFGSSSADSNMKMIDSIRHKLQGLLEN